MNMLTNLTMQKQSPSGLGSLPSNTVANPRGNVKAITTRSGVAYDGPMIPPTSYPLPKEVKRETEATKDKLVEVAVEIADLAVASTYCLFRMEEAFRTRNYTTADSHDTTDFVVVDYDVDPWVPLILERPFLRTTRALVDVYGEELILRDGDEQLIFHTDTTSIYPNEHRIESVKIINFIDVSCKDNFEEVLMIKEVSPHNGIPLLQPDSSLLVLTPLRLVIIFSEEFAMKLALLDPFPLGIGNADFDPEGDIHLLDKLLNNDPSSPLPPKELNFKELKMIKSSIDDFPLLTF
ncbi:hypothetical protein Tco_0895131 [Tanacetum coccineum]|uniref:Reverse transcriptase domain-containing protein n=1 Tax=Tanacetum coccineum TaxID=301880 RepID=A0ABQ5CK00_9ASTR